MSYHVSCHVSCHCVLSMCLGPYLFSPRPLSPIRNPRSRPCMYGTYTSVQLRIVLKPCFSPSHHADEQCRLLYLSPPAIPYSHLHLYLHLLNVTYEIRMFVTFNMCHVVSACHCVKGVFSLFEKSLFFVCLQIAVSLYRVVFVACVGVRGRLKKYKKIIK